MQIVIGKHFADFFFNFFDSIHLFIYLLFMHIILIHSKGGFDSHRWFCLLPEPTNDINTKRIAMDSPSNSIQRTIKIC